MTMDTPPTVVLVEKLYHCGLGMRPYARRRVRSDDNVYLVRYWICDKCGRRDKTSQEDIPHSVPK